MDKVYKKASVQIFSELLGLVVEILDPHLIPDLVPGADHSLVLHQGLVPGHDREITADDIRVQGRGAHITREG